MFRRCFSLSIFTCYDLKEAIFIQYLDLKESVRKDDINTSGAIFAGVSYLYVLSGEKRFVLKSDWHVTSYIYLVGNLDTQVSSFVLS